MKTKTCKNCGRPLAEMNEGDKCFRHQPIIVSDYLDTGQAKHRELREDEIVRLINGPSLCSSRTTIGFNIVQRQYQGEPAD